MYNVMFKKRKAIEPNKIECKLGNDVENTFISWHQLSTDDHKLGLHYIPFVFKL